MDKSRLMLAIYYKYYYTITLPMNYYLISDEQLDLIDQHEYVEIIREGRKDPGYTVTMNNDGTYTRHYYSDEHLKDGEVLVHFYGDSREVEKRSFVLTPFLLIKVTRVVPDTSDIPDF